MAKIKAKLGKAFKVLYLLACVAAVIFGLYFLTRYIRSGDQIIYVSTASQYYADSTLQAIVDVKTSKNTMPTKATVKAEIVDANGKTVKGTKKTYTKGETEKVSIELPLPDKLVGSYKLKVTAINGIKKDTKEVSLKINSKKNQEIVVNFDKGIYKPNDTVNYRALIINSNSYEPINSDVTVSIYDANNNKVYMNNSKTSEFGIVSGSFTLGDELNSGDYKIEVISQDTTVTKSFKVNPYITPQYEISINSDKESYLINDIAHFTVNAKYFFGEPVVNASITVGVNDNSNFVTGLTNDQGNFEFDYTVDTDSSINVNVTAEDEAHYYVESSKTVYASINVFNIEMLPEYGNLVKGVSNKVYVVTTKPDGTPIKTRSTVRFDTLEKQLLTDEDGIGYIELTSSDIPTKSSISVSIDAQDYEGNKVLLKDTINVDTNSRYAIKTDKVKYNENDDILVSIDGGLENQEKNIMIYKGAQLIKLYSSSDNEVAVNLEGVSGLVDIVVASTNQSLYRYNYNNRRYSYIDDIAYDDIAYTGFTGGLIRRPSYSSTNYDKRTVFIKPESSLAVNITTDKEEYKPGDTLNLKIDTKVGEKATDTGILVSILDNAVLSLADNDLTIDNVKLALEDIVLSDGVTAADLYAMVVEDKNPAKLQTLLLKQTNDSISLNISQSYAYKDSEYKYSGIALLALAVFLIVVYVAVKKSKDTGVNTFKKLFCTMAAFFLLLVITSGISKSTVGLIISLAITIGVTVLFYKIIKKDAYVYIFDIVFYYIVLGPIVVSLLSEYSWRADSEFSFWSGAVIVPAAIVVWLYLKYINEGKVKRKALVSFACNAACAIFTWVVFYLVVDNESDYWFIMLAVSILGFIAKRKFINAKIDGKEKSKSKKTVNKDGNIQVNINVNKDAVLAVVLIVAVLGAVGIKNILTTFATSNINEAVSDGISQSSPRRETSTFSGSMSDSYDVNQFAAHGDSSSASNAASSINPFSAIGDALMGSNGALTKAEANVNSAVEETDAEIAAAPTSSGDSGNISATTTKVRNVFLESLAFLPDLVAKNGSLETEIPISDNITTWNIQAVGNTKKGDLGYSTKEFRVFKDFFVNFELPKNSVVTDKYTLPITVYNYTENSLTVDLAVENADWFNNEGLFTEYNTTRTGDTIQISVNKGTYVVYLPIEVLKAGENKLRITAKANGLEDVIEKSFTVLPNGLNKTNVVSSGIITDDYSTDYFTKEESIVEGTRNIKVKLYPNLASQQLENIDSILRMPTGCFEQTSSSLYPDGLVLKYLNNSKKDNSEAKAKALEYINKGYQRLLTFEVPGSNGGFSLYGNKPAEVALTAYGLMELTDLSKVYDVDQNVLTRMKDYVYTQGQSANGSIKVDEHSYLGSHLGNTKLTVEAYTIWALSEADPSDTRLQKSITYLEGKVDEADDPYTLALMANALVNGKSKKANDVISRLIAKVEQGSNGEAYVVSKVRDYYGCYGRWQNVQATALTSLALSRSNSDPKTNAALIQYLVASKDAYGSWGNTQATVMALKALDADGEQEGFKSQKVKISYGTETKEIEVDVNNLTNYTVTFENAPAEGKIVIDKEKGRLYYEVVEDYYVEYDKATVSNGITVGSSFSNGGTVGINETITQTILVNNSGDEDIVNGLVKVSIPQGMSVLEESLSKLVVENKIQKYDYNYNTLNLYLKNTNSKASLVLDVQYRAVNAGEYTGGAVRVYDYYNPEYEGLALPQTLKSNLLFD